MPRQASRVSGRAALQRQYFRVGASLVIAGCAITATTTLFMFGPGVRAPLDVILGIAVIGLLATGVVLIASSVQRVNTTRVIAWCVPGLLAVLAYALARNPAPVPDWLDGPPIIVMWLGGAIVGPFTSLGASVMAFRSRSIVHALACLVSWIGTLLIWTYRP